MFLQTLFFHRRNMVPHVHIASVAQLHYQNLHSFGIKYLVFDKDNTLTLPYKPHYFTPQIQAAILEDCIKVFAQENVAILSNSVGSKDDAPDYKEALEVERTLQLPVIRHEKKKPAVKDDILRHFGTDKVDEIAVIGDRVLSDVVLGNSHGMFTVLVKPFDKNVENFAVKGARKLEDFLLEGLLSETRPPQHPRISYVQLK